MNSKRRIAYIVSLTLSLVVLGSCAGGVVSKRDYMSRVYEREKLAEQLAALQSEHARLKGEKEALDKEVSALQAERDSLEEARTDLQLNNLSLKSEINQLKKGLK